jgi:hypothetical protein
MNIEAQRSLEVLMSMLVICALMYGFPSISANNEAGSKAVPREVIPRFVSWLFLGGVTITISSSPNTGYEDEASLE